MPDGEPRPGFLGLPTWVWIVGGIIVLVIIWFVFFRNSSGSSVPPTTGGGGGAATQSVRLQKGAVKIDISADGDKVQPKPPRHKREKEEHKHMPPERPPHRKTFPEPPTGPEPPHKKKELT